MQHQRRLTRAFKVAAALMLVLNASSSRAQGPGPREGHALVYDTRLKKVLLLHGDAGTPPAASTMWGWDGTRWTIVADSGPAPRVLTSATYDSRRDRVVLYGGYIPATNATTDETWEWDGGRWSPVAPGSVGVRDHHMMAYDAARGVTVMYGGTVPREFSGPRPTSWDWPATTFELKNGKWSDVGVAGPGSRNVAAMAYDGARKCVVLFGGYGEDRVFRGDTWTWDGVRWKKVADSGPPARANHRMVFDSRSGVVLLYGGGDDHTQFEDLWKWDGREWTAIPMQGSTPGPRGRHAMAYDEARGRVVLYGGRGPSGVLSDTWEWDGDRWTRRE